MAREGGITQLRSELPELIAVDLPRRTQTMCMRVAQLTAERAQANAQGQYSGDFHIEARPLSGAGGEVRGGQQREGTFISGSALTTSGTGGVLRGEGAGVYADWFWFFGEFGTTKQPPRPFMIPAFEVARREVGAAAKAAYSGLG